MNKFYAKGRVTKLLAAMLLVFVSSGVFAAKLTGVITDGSDKSGLPGVIVNADGKTTITDIDGKYSLELAPGKHKLTAALVTFVKQELTVTMGTEDQTLDIVMMPSEQKSLKAVNVTSARNTQTETAVMLEMRKSNVIASGIGAAQISRTMDRSAADVVKRVPGVTVRDDKFICVRGLFDRYNSVFLNDAGAPSTESDKKSFSFDLIPSGLIDRIIVYKSPSPELPGDFAGGMVKIYTTAMPVKTQYNLNVQSSYLVGTTGQDFLHQDRSKTDWLGKDDGSRALPSDFPEVGTFTAATKTDTGLRNSLAHAFRNDWAVNKQKAMPDMRVTASASNIFKLGRVKLGNTAGLNYTHLTQNYAIDRQIWDIASISEHTLDQQAEEKVNVGLMENIGFSLGNTLIEFRNLYSQVGVSRLLYRTETADTFSQTPGKDYALEYDSRRIYSGQLSGSHHNDDETRKYNWTLGYQNVYRNQPNGRRLSYTSGLNTEGDTVTTALVSATVDPNNGGGRFYADLHEQVYSFNHQFTQNVRIRKFRFDVSAGNYLEFKDRSYTSRTGLGYTLRSSSPFRNELLMLPIEQIFADSNVGSKNKFQITDISNKSDFYNASNKLVAGFVSVNLPIGEKFKLNGGVRYEHNVQSITGYSVANDSSEFKLETAYLLPSVNATYNITDKMALRAGYGKTLNRPEFRELAPIHYYDPVLRADFQGSLRANPIAPNGDSLKVAEVHNFDVRWEMYPSAGEVIQVGAFYKDIKNPIQQIILNTGNLTYSFTNGSRAYVYGVELDARKNLRFVDELLHTRAFRNLTAVANLTLSKSEVTTDTAGPRSSLLPKATLQSQSPYVVNLGAYYQDDSIGFQTTLLYNVFGPRLYALGTATGTPSQGDLPFHSLDLTIAKTFAKHYTIALGAQNLLDQSVRQAYDFNQDGKFDLKDDRIWRSYRPGRYFTVSVRLRF